METEPEPTKTAQQLHIPLLSVTSFFLSVTGIFGVAALANVDTTADTLTFHNLETVAPVVYRPQQSETLSALSSETITETENIPYGVNQVADGSMDAGTSTVIQHGANGTITRTFAIEKYYDEEIARTLITEQRTEPTEQIIRFGTRPVHVDTGSGDFAYTRKLTVYATSYDGNCLGCSGTTATGTPVYHGICAVDPTVIPLGTRFYVPNYGACIAADTGGAIKGNKIDVGFEDVRFGWWSSRWVEIYIE